MAKGHKTTETHAADAATTAMQGNVYDAAKRAAAGYKTVGPNAGMTDSMSLWGDMAGYGRTGAAALAGDQGAVNQMMNPYLQSVLGGYRDEFGHASGMLRKNVNDAATQSGAFGGDRAALEQGALQGELGRGYGSQVAGLLAGGYDSAMQRAGGLANLGMGAAGARFDGGNAIRGIEQEQANPELMRQQILAQGMQTGNAGNYTNSTYKKTGAMQNILGGAATLGGLFGGVGGLAGLFGGGGAMGSMAGAGLFGNTDAVRSAIPGPSQLPNVNRSIWGGY